MDLLAKIHKSFDRKRVVVLCDKDLIGKRFEENGLQLDLASNFYRGEEMEESRILDLLRMPGSLNIVGKKAVDFCIRNGLVDQTHIKKIADVPFAFALLAE